MEKLRTAVFISGRGSNLQNLIKSCGKKSFPARICLIISNNPNAKGLVYGKRAKIPVKIISQKNHKTQKNELAIGERAFEYTPSSTDACNPTNTFL